MSNPAIGATPSVPSRPVLDSIFGSLWPDVRSGATTAGRPRLVAAALGVGLLASIVVPFRDPGLGSFLVVVAVGGVVLAATWERVTAGLLAQGALCLLLVSTLVIRDAEWIVTLSLMAAFAVGSVTLTGGRSVAALLASGLAVPLASLRGLPWLGRSLTLTGRPGSWWPFARTIGVSVVLVLVFGALFASADALFAQWAGALVPDLAVETLSLRVFVLAAVFGLTTAAVYVALAPPLVERLSLPASKQVRRFEWMVPVGLVTLTFGLFLVAQLTALFGGHDYLRRTTGLTYADYVHQGFGQLTLATVLTLLVVATTARHAPLTTASDRRLLRAMLGLLCLLTLVVVASALYRMHVYEEAYGFTRLRLLVSLFEGWLGVVVVLVLGAGATLRGGWVPRAAMLTGAVMLLGLAAANPDGYIAGRNIERLEQTGRIDWTYLSGLSADAVPAFQTLPGQLRPCVLMPRPAEDDWLEWNLGRARAAGLLDKSGPGQQAGCVSQR